MNNTIKLYIVLLIVLLAGIIYIDAVKPKEIDWKPTYDLKDKIPFGLYVFDNELKDFLKGNKISKTSRTLYEYYNNEKTIVGKDYEYQGNILSVSENYTIDDQSTDEVLNFVSQGNTAFISCKEFPKKLMDSLNFEIDANLEFSDTINVWMANKNLGQTKYNLNNGAGNNYFSEIDTLKTTVLGYQGKEKSKKINFIKVPFYNGFFYLHMQPACFTNYHLLKDNHYQYTEKVISYLPKGNLLWLIKGQNGEVVSDSPFRYILSQPALKWAMWISILGILIFMIFNAKRKQRVVPIIKPLPNTTVDFTKTIGNLYYQEGNHQNIIDKKIIYFLERIRNELLIDTSSLDESFEKKLHQKTGKDIQDIEKVVRLINYQKKSYNQSIEEDLIELNNAIEKIFGD